MTDQPPRPGLYPLDISSGLRGPCLCCGPSSRGAGTIWPELNAQGPHGINLCFLQDLIQGRGTGHQRSVAAPLGGESIHRVTAAAFAAARPGTWPGGVHRAPTASAGCAAMRAPCARPWLRTRPAGMRSSGSPGSWPPSAAEFRCVSLTLRSHPKTSNLFPEFGGMFVVAN